MLADLCRDAEHPDPGGLPHDRHSVDSRADRRLGVQLSNPSHRWRSWLLPGMQAATPYVYASPALGVNARTCRSVSEAQTGGGVRVSHDVQFFRTRVHVAENPAQRSLATGQDLLHRTHRCPQISTPTWDAPGDLRHRRRPATGLLGLTARWVSVPASWSSRSRMRPWGPAAEARYALPNPRTVARSRAPLRFPSRLAPGRRHLPRPARWPARA